jgi:zinc D-Ala-D-Ala carboxypeptidase
MKHFTIDEFKCPCCGEVHMQEVFLKTLDYARDLAEIPFVITSGYRCPKHNAKIGGQPNSAHTKGFAADIKCTNSKDRFTIVEAARQAGIKRIGIGENFIHLDIDPDKPQRVMWTYYNELKRSKR